MLFFFLDEKEYASGRTQKPKNQGCQKKSRNLTSHSTEIMKFPSTQ
jgi:hypothetical protein